MLKKIIERPVLATVISIILVILGLLSLIKLPMSQLPDLAPPTVQVSAVYPGANAETVLRTVAPSIEEAINGVENMTYITSTASNDGTLTVTVYFKLGTNADQAAVNVQNRVSQATSRLPGEVIQQGIVTAKQENSFIVGMGIWSEDNKIYDATFIANYAQINIVPEINRIPGVSSASILGGSKDYAMRIWLNPAQLESYKITPAEVMAAIQDKSSEAAPGKIGQDSKETFEYVIKYKGKFNKPEEYENIVIRANSNGSVLRLRDVARVELGAYSYTNLTRMDGKLGSFIRVIQLSTGNANDIQVAIAKLMDRISKDFPPGMKYSIIYTKKDALDESIKQVVHTLIEAFILVFIVVYLFLQDFRSTLIPAIAVPVALIGTFFFMPIFGFSINLLTLFALVLAIGIVVDDAIVVVEAVHAKMEHKHLGPTEATIEAMHEITGAIVSITFVMAAVFLPVGLMDGSTGLFYRQFAFTMATAIIISAVNALTLSPALTALLLKDVHAAKRLGKQPTTFKERFFEGFNRNFEALNSKYTGGLKLLIRHKWVSMTGLAIVVVGVIWLVRTTKTGFIPPEDQGFVAVAVDAPSGTSLSRTSAILKVAESVLGKDPATRQITSLPGFNLLTGSTSPSASLVFVVLKDPDKRGKIQDINVIMEGLRKKLSSIPQASFFVFSFPTVPGFSSVEALDIVLQDKTGGNLNKFSGVANHFITELMKKPAVAFAFTSFKADYPQLQLEINEDKASQLGVKTQDVLQTMQIYFGSAQVSDFNRFGKYYRVIVEADIGERADVSAINKIFVKNSAGEMVPISSIVHLTRVYGTEVASRYNLFNSIEINVIPKPGYSSGEAIEAIRQTALEQLPSGFSYDFIGQTREEISSGGQSAVVFLLCLIFVYFLLSAQYESYILPFAVILSIPTGVLGVFLAIGFSGIENNIYVQVALIMLIGLLAKNAILIVEFAVQRRKAGLGLVSAALEAARLRVRPIIMTSVAFVFGLFPMSIATGPSAQGNHSISIASAGGMVSGVILGLFIIPVLFVIFQGLQEKVTGRPFTVMNIDALEAYNRLNDSHIQPD